MARLPRILLQMFGSTGPLDDFGKFGSQAAGSPLKTKDISVIQSLPAWLTGWRNAILSGVKTPFLEDMNSAFLVHSYMQSYMFQEGVPEWDATTTYYAGGIVKKPGTYELYGSIVDNNLNQTLPSQQDDSNWVYLGSRQPGYRRPELSWTDTSKVDVKANTGTANQTVAKFPDGVTLTVTEDLASTQKYRRCNLANTANWTSGTESGGVRPGLTLANDTWYAVYLVRSQIDQSKFVMVLDDTLPLGNFATLNTRYGINRWLYVLTIPRGMNAATGNQLGSTCESDLVKFIQDGPRVRFMPFTTNWLGPMSVVTEGGVCMQASNVVALLTSGNDAVIWSYAAGSGAGQIPAHIDLAHFRLQVVRGGGASSSVRWGNIMINGTDDPVATCSAMGFALTRDTLTVLSFMTPGSPEYNSVLLSEQNAMQTVKLRETMNGFAPNEVYLGRDLHWSPKRGVRVFYGSGANWPENVFAGLTLLGFHDSMLVALNNAI